MKDIARHLRYQQRKVLREVRQRRLAEAESGPILIMNGEKLESPVKSTAKFDPNHRKPRLLKRASWH